MPSAFRSHPSCLKQKKRERFLNLWNPKWLISMRVGASKQGRETPVLKVGRKNLPSKSVIHREIINGWQQVFIMEAYMALTTGLVSENILIKKGKSNFIGKYKSGVRMSANERKETEVVIAGLRPGPLLKVVEGLVNVQAGFPIK